MIAVNQAQIVRLLGGGEVVNRLRDRLEALRRQMRELQAMERAVADAPDHQVSLTDPDARAMATNGKGTGMVGYNVQAVVDAKHHLIILHEVTNIGHDRSQMANWSRWPDRPRRPRLPMMAPASR
jgi:hypothetical protein